MSAISSSRRLLQVAVPQAVELAGKKQVLVHRQLVVEGKFLRHIADHFLDCVALAQDIAAPDARRAVGRLENSAQHPDDGGFAGAVRAEKAENRAACDRKTDMINRGETAEALRQAVALDHRVHQRKSEMNRKT